MDVKAADINKHGYDISLKPSLEVVTSSTIVVSLAAVLPAVDGLIGPWVDFSVVIGSGEVDVVVSEVVISQSWVQYVPLHPKAQSQLNPFNLKYGVKIKLFAMMSCARIRLKL